MTEASTLRAFLAVPADPAWVESAEELVRRLRSELPDASWTRPESWHLTLCFLGEAFRSQVERFAAQIAPHARATSGGDLASAGAVVFPPHGAARVLAAGFADSAASAALSRLAQAAASLAPSMQDPRSKVQSRFRAHITFARLRRPWPRQAVEHYRAAVDAWQPLAFRARSCVLFQSRLDPAGAIHTPLESWNFTVSPVEARA